MEQLFHNQNATNEDNTQITIGRLPEADTKALCEKDYPTIIRE